MKWTVALLAAFFFSHAPAMAAEKNFHIVKHGETFILIAKKYLGDPVYNPTRGSYVRLQRLNPEIEDPSVIYPGQKIFLGEAKRKLSSAPDPAEPLAEEKADPPSAAPESAGEKKRSPFEHLNTTVGYQFTRLDVVDKGSATSTRLDSSRDLSLGLGWETHWSDQLNTFFHYSFRSVEFNNPVGAPHTLSVARKSFNEISLGGSSQITHAFSIKGSVAYGQELSLRALSGADTALDAVPETTLHLDAAYKVYEQGNTSVGPSVGLSYMGGGAPQGYTLNSGYEWRAGAFLKTQFDAGSSLSLHAGFQQRRQDTSSFELHERNVFGLVMFAIPFFGPDGN